MNLLVLVGLLVQLALMGAAIGLFSWLIGSLTIKLWRLDRRPVLMAAGGAVALAGGSLIVALVSR